MATRLYSAAPWGNLSGAPICALEHARVLRNVFDEVCLVLCEHGPLEDRAREAGIATWCRPLAFRGLRRAGPVKFIRNIGAVAASRMAYVVHLQRLLRDRPGILHIHSRAAHLPYALLAGWLARVPVVVTIHEPWEEGWESRSELWMVRIVADKIIYLTQAMNEQYPHGTRPVAIIGNFYPVSETGLRMERARPLVIMAAQMVRAKGIDVFLEVCRRLHERGVVFEAWMLGNWLAEADRAAADAFIREHGLSDVVSIRGLVASLEPVYAEASVLLLPTRRDSFPRVVMEAMGHGLPVVATRVDGIPEMVEDGVTGILVDPEDVEGFSGAVERLLKEPELRARMGAAGRERVGAMFSPEAYVRAMVRVYDGLRHAPKETGGL